MKREMLKRRTRKRTFVITAQSAVTLMLTVMILSACGAEETAGPDGQIMMEDGKEAESSQRPEPQEPWTDLTPRPIDFPFPYSMEEYTLSLVPLRDEPGQYDLRLCNEYGTIVQQLSCGALTEPVTFRYDDLYYDYYADLEIFSAESQTGLLFPFDTENDGFMEESIEIPRYDDIDGPNIMVREENEEYVEKKIYQLNTAYDRMEELRRWHLEKETGMLEIWSNLEQRTIFSGQVVLDENWEPVNTKYYSYHLWNAWYLPGSFAEQDTIPVWISEPREEKGEREESGF